MRFIRSSSSVLLVLVLSLSALFASIAKAHAFVETLPNIPNNDQRTEGYKDLGNKSISAARKWLRGRKTAGSEHAEMKYEVMEAAKKQGAKNTGANTDHVHGDQEKKLEVTVGLSGRSRPSGGKLKFVGLVPFSSDYRTPRTHPPKNN